jgi:hypothetical protein
MTTTYQHEVVRRVADARDGVAEEVGVQGHPAGRGELALPVDDLRAGLVRLGVVAPDHHRSLLLLRIVSHGRLGRHGTHCTDDRSR